MKEMTNIPLTFWDKSCCQFQLTVVEYIYGRQVHMPDGRAGYVHEDCLMVDQEILNLN